MPCAQCGKLHSYCAVMSLMASFNTAYPAWLVAELLLGRTWGSAVQLSQLTLVTYRICLNCWGRNFICHYFNISCDVSIKALSVNVKSLLVLLFQLAELRQECEARGLETKGNKGELIARLQAYLEEHGKSQRLWKNTWMWPTSCKQKCWSLSVWLSPCLLPGKLLHPHCRGRRGRRWRAGRGCRGNAVGKVSGF